MFIYNLKLNKKAVSRVFIIVSFVIILAIIIFSIYIIFFKNRNQSSSDVKFDEIIIVPYGTPKETLSTGILFDDEERNRNEWKGLAVDAKFLPNW